MRIHFIAIAAVLVSQTAWASPPDFPNHGKPTVGAKISNPCGEPRFGPRADLGREVLVDHCNQLRAKLQAMPNNADLRAKCDRAAKALSGHDCGESAASVRSQ